VAVLHGVELDQGTGKGVVQLAAIGEAFEHIAGFSAYDCVVVIHRIATVAVLLADEQIDVRKVEIAVADDDQVGLARGIDLGGIDAAELAAAAVALRTDGISGAEHAALATQ